MPSDEHNLRPSEAKLFAFVEAHPEGATPDDIKHLYNGMRSRVTTAGQIVWKLGLIRKKAIRQKEHREGMGQMMATRIVYYPKDSAEGILCGRTPKKR